MMLLVAAIAIAIDVTVGHADQGTPLPLLSYPNHHMLALFVCRVEGIPHLSLTMSTFRR
jgi:hypothetical protein